MLSAQQLETFRRDGILLVENVADSETLAVMRAAMAALVEESRTVTQHNAVYDIERDHSAAHPRLRRIKHPHKRHAAFNDFPRREPLLGILKQLLGPDVRMHSSKLNLKAESGGSSLEWHQDWAFHPHTNRSLITVGLLLEDCRMEHGPMLVLPGTHHGPIHDHNANGRFCGAINSAAVQFDYANAVACTGKAGTLTLHHAFSVHGSAANTSSEPRPLLLYEFMSADNWPLLGVSDLAEFDSRMICGNTTYNPRLEAVPVRLPLPAAANLGSIYENQTELGRRYFVQP
jgi:ectoine hydroxylase-related dioxygenase (phytanoyl-CoA dioxygenase family)